MEERSFKLEPPSNTCGLHFAWNNGHQVTVNEDGSVLIVSELWRAGRNEESRSRYVSVSAYFQNMERCRKEGVYWALHAFRENLQGLNGKMVDWSTEDPHRITIDGDQAVVVNPEGVVRDRTERRRSAAAKRAALQNHVGVAIA